MGKKLGILSWLTGKGKNSYTIECPNCKFINAGQSKFCAGCGSCLELQIEKQIVSELGKNDNAKNLTEIKMWLDDWSTYDARVNVTDAELEKANDVGDTWPRISREMYGLLWDPVLKGYDDLLSYLDKDWERMSEKNPVNCMKAYIRLVDVSPVQDIRREIEVGYVKASERAIDDLVGYLESSIFPLHQEISLASLVSNENQKNQQKNNIQYTLRQQATEVQMLLGELQNMQVSLQQQKLQVFSLLSEQQESFGDIARGAGLGALAVMNPFIGVPALVASWCSADKKDKQNQQVIDQCFDSIEKYLDKWQAVYEIYGKISDQHVDYLRENYVSTISKGIMAVLYFIDQNGSQVKTPEEYNLN